MKASLIYFSATGTTARIASAILEGTEMQETNTYKILHCPEEIISLPEDEIAIIAVPVFSGRVPAIAKEALERIKGNNTPAIIACVYGNRDFDDALVELHDIVHSNGFIVISAGAFIAQHSIFPKVGHGRPDINDLLAASGFGRQSMEYFQNNKSAEIDIKGNNPYRAIKKIPLSPKTNKNCNQCGLCLKDCPTQAINQDNPHKIDKKLCIACAHCIAICPKKAKQFNGLLYKVAANKFEKKYTERLNVYTVYR